MAKNLSVKNILNEAGVSAKDANGKSLSDDLAKALVELGCYTTGQPFKPSLKVLIITKDPETANRHAQGLARGEFQIQCVRPLEDVLKTISPQCRATSGADIDFNYMAERLALYGLRVK